jgi:hypothetical protein
VQKVRVDVSYVPELLTYLDTTPASTIDPVLVGPRDPELPEAYGTEVDVR